MKDYFQHPSSFVDEPCIIGKDTKIWHFCHISKDANIGSNVSFGQNVYVGEGVHIASNCKIQNNVSIYRGVTLEEDVFCGPSMVFTNVINPRSQVNRKEEFKQTLVRKGASIGANATIICGSIIGSYAFIGAGSVVTKDVKDFAVIAGVPGKQIGWSTKDGTILDMDLRCKKSNHQYKFNEDGTPVKE